MNGLERIRQAVDLREPDRVPFYLPDHQFACRFSNITYYEHCTRADKLFESLSSTVERFGYDGTWLLGDDWIEVDVMGHQMRFFEDSPPHPIDYPVKRIEDVDRIEIPDPWNDGRMPVRLKALEMLRNRFGDRILITGHINAPWSMSCLIAGMKLAMITLRRDPSFLRSLLDLSYKNALRYAKAEIQAGAHAIWVGDDMASSWIISQRDYTEWALPYEAKLIRELKQSRAITFIGMHEKDEQRAVGQIKSGAHVLSVGMKADLGRVSTSLKSRACFLGNIDPDAVITQGDPGMMTREIKRCLRVAARGGGYLFGIADVLHPDTPVEKLDQFINIFRKYRDYPLRNLGDEAGVGIQQTS
jgi:uroporphyrinogen decarboxylase